jgi:membrane associated rhomboid family serine protease
MGTVGGVSWLSGSDQDRPWFRIRSYGVGTTDFVAGVSVVMMLVSVASQMFVTYLALFPFMVLRGYVWQVVTWPFANGLGFLPLWNALVFWLAGRQLEGRLGKGRFGWMLLSITLVGSILAILLSLGMRLPPLGGLDTIALIVMLLFIAENPRMPFFFSIPAWVVGVVFVAVPLLTRVADRNWAGLLHFVLTLLAAALIAKSAGLLEGYAFIPGHAYTPRRRTAVKGVPRESRRRKSTPRPSAGSSNVVQGPWFGPEPPAREDEEMDALLDKIMDRGLESLTSRERKRLEELRQQRRAR